MDIRQVTPDYAVAPQIDLADLAEAAAQGFRVLVCNRPDDEVPPDLGSTAMAEAAQAAGLHFVFNPVVNGAMTMEMVTNQGEALADADGPVLAYCRSGTRSTIVWALSEAGRQPTDAILAAAAKAGYDLGGLRGQIDRLAGTG